jgi:Zn-dependent metalloprotease
MFIPPHVMANLAKAGVPQARASLQHDLQTRKKRKATAVPMAKFMGAGPPAKGKSKIAAYDSQHKEEFQVKLVWSDGGPPVQDEDVTKAVEFTKTVRRFYKEVLERDSIDNDGQNFIINVHYGENYMNAFWYDNQITFGDGDGQIFTSFSKSLDVLAHEFGHGVTEYTANLEYQGQSGALNEHFSDVFGSAITQFHLKQTAQTADWLLGDEIMGPELFGEALRSIKEPGTAYDHQLMGRDPQPAHMKDYYAGPDDNQGVHINSGIPNKAFYKVSDAIETDKAVLIWYAALQKLWSTAKFNDAVTVIVEAARLLNKAGKVPLGSPQFVRAAFKDVGLPHP